MESKPSKYTTISIPILLNNKLKQLITNTGFASVSSFVVYILRQILSEKTENSQTVSYDFSKEDEEKVKQRLKSLGYM